MFQTLSIHHPKQHFYPRIYSILNRIFLHPTETHFSTAASIETLKTTPKKDISSLEEVSGIAKSVVSKCSHLLNCRKGEISNTPPLKDYLLRLSDCSPEIVRRFWRVSVLNTQDVLEILLGFESEAEVKKVVECLWGMFKWASGQNREFVHFPQSCKIMASMLVRNGYFSEAEYLLSSNESRAILLDCEEIFENLIEGYLGEFELDKGLSVYKGMRKMGFVPSYSSYKAILEYLVELNETELMYNVYLDMMEMGMGMDIEENGVHGNVIRLLCVNGKVQEARDIVKKIMSFGIKPSDLVVNAISSGYCDKKDYEDLLSFFAEANIAPDVKLGNKIIFSLCRSFGEEHASVFLQKLEGLNFCPDEITFGILIGFSCHEGNLKIAFFYISEILSRGLKPHVYSYNALLSGMFKEGMWMHARDVLTEMNDMGVTPNMSTFRVLLAGFCKARQFDEVKAIVSQMSDSNLVKLTSLDDLLTKGFVILGLSPSAVKIKRDNDKGFSKTEFFDNLGNGLYLDTDHDEYEKKITRVLEDAMVLDFDSSIIEQVHSLDVKSIRTMVDEMAKWGQELSSPALSSLLNRLCKAPFSVETINYHLSLMSKSIYQLDHKTLNMLVRVYTKKGLTFKARALFDGMVRRGYTIDNDTYSALLFDSCKKGDLRSFRYFYELARESNWSPEAKDGNALLGYLCKNKWLNEVFKLFEIFNDTIDAFHSLLEKLCSHGLTSTARVLIKEFSNRAIILHQTAYSHLVSGFCQEKKITEALSIFEIMLSRNLSPSADVFTQMVYQVFTINPDKAFELKQLCSRDQPCALIPINRALIEGFSKLGKSEEAASLFKEVLSMGFFPDVKSFNFLIEGYCGENNLKKVKELVGVMIRKNLSISISSYSKMMRSICAEENISLALSLKELMLQISDFPQLVLYNILIFHVSSIRNAFVLDEIVFGLGKKGLHFDDATYNFVIRGFLLCNDTVRSLNYLTAMISHDYRPSNRCLRNIISFLCRNGDLKLAVDLSREMELRGWIFGSDIQNNIVEALLANGKLIEAVEFLNRIASENLIPDRVNYDYLIKRFYQHRRLNKAVDLLNIMLKKGTKPESTSYDYIIRGFCDIHKWDIALDFYTEMLYRDLKPSSITWEILVCGLSECGRLGEAETIFKTMIEIGEMPRREVFETLIDKYRRDENIKKASEILKIMQQKGYVPDFETHWSVISNLSDSSKKDDGRGFLSSILSGFGFARKKNDDSNAR